MMIGASTARWKFAETIIGYLCAMISRLIAVSVSINASCRSGGRVKTLIPVAILLPRAMGVTGMDSSNRRFLPTIPRLYGLASGGVYPLLTMIGPTPPLEEQSHGFFRDSNPRGCPPAHAERHAGGNRRAIRRACRREGDCAPHSGLGPRRAHGGRRPQSVDAFEIRARHHERVDRAAGRE